MIILIEQIKLNIASVSVLYMLYHKKMQFCKYAMVKKKVTCTKIYATHVKISQNISICNITIHKVMLTPLCPTLISLFSFYYFYSSHILHTTHSPDTELFQYHHWQGDWIFIHISLSVWAQCETTVLTVSNTDLVW